ERGLVCAARVRAKVGCDSGVEVARRGSLAQALGLLAVGTHPAAPGLERVGRVGTEEVGHGPPLGRQRARRVKAGMTSAANHSSCSRITDSGAPMGWLTDTRSSPGESFSTRLKASTIFAGRAERAR